jgi:pyrimidine-nucleoside phosphorylase
VALDMPRFKEQVRRVGAAVMGQTLRLCPADKILYALRDVTATVDSVPLIASSIMSKKLAAGADIIMLDVKTGNGAFMPRLKDATRLAQTMVDIGRHAGRRTCAIISDMSQPLGRAVGNTLEVIEAIDILNGHDGGDLLTVALALASRMLIMGRIVSSESKAMTLLQDALASGRARDVLKNLIDAQNGDSRVIHDTSLMPRAPIIHTIHAKESGFLSTVDCRGLGLAAGRLGAGRITKDDTIDLRVGFICRKRLGDRINTGDALFEVHASSDEKLAEVIPMLEACLTIGSDAQKPKLIEHTIV